jgi:hypothetical protein
MLDITRLKAELGQIQRSLIVIGASKQARHLFDELRAAASGCTDAALVWHPLFSDCASLTRRLLQTTKCAMTRWKRSTT